MNSLCVFKIQNNVRLSRQDKQIYTDMQHQYNIMHIKLYYILHNII